MIAISLRALEAARAALDLIEIAHGEDHPTAHAELARARAGLDDVERWLRGAR